MKLLFAVLCLVPYVGWGQQAEQQPLTVQTPPLKIEVKMSVVVLGTPDPVAESQSSRSAATLEVAPRLLLSSGPVDLLREDTVLDLQERGGGGVQTDVTLRGGSFEQTLVLLDGFRINDAETSHFNLDLPVPVAAIGEVSVLHGAGSTLYGSDAVSGVVDFMTAVPPPGPLLRLRSGGGSYGENDQAALVSWGGFGTGKRGSEVAAGEREFSDGFIADRDYRSEEASSETRFGSWLGATDILLAGSDRRFGAAGFYGDYNSWERTKGWFAALSQKLDAKTQAALAYRRHSDIFLLERDEPSGYKNQHIDTSWQGALRRKETLLSPQKLELFYGLEVNADQIDSTNLGRHGRNRGAGYVDVELHEGRGTLSVGGREEVFSGGRSVLVPSVAGSRFLGTLVKLRAAAAKGFRLPTYTDLYYSDPTTLGNAKLLPESVWNYEGGVDWYAGARLKASVTAFHSVQTDAIDYVRANSTVPWQAENLNGVRFTGTEASVEWRLSEAQTLRFAATTLAGTQSALHGLQSEYVFNYPAASGSAEWTGRFNRAAERDGFVARQRVRVVNRELGSVYPVWDSAVAYERGLVQPYLQMTNLSNTGYREIVGVRMQGRAFVGGVQVVWGRSRD